MCTEKCLYRKVKTSNVLFSISNIKKPLLEARFPQQTNLNS